MMTHSSPARRLLLMSAGALLAATPAAAQIGEPVEQHCTCIEELQERFGELQERLQDVRTATRLPFTTRPRQARLGVTLAGPAEVNGATGVRLEEVSDGGPAHRAGLRGGDVLVALNGDALGPAPAARLVERMASVEPGDTVETTFYRGSEERTARVAAEAAPGMRAPAMRLLRTPAHPPRPPHATAPRMRALEHPDAPAPQRLQRHFRVSRAGGSGLDLAAVSPGLGDYFGTDRGVLVTAVEEDSPLNLRAGDVILSVGGRDIQDPAHVRAILASYRADEEIAIRIIRERKTLEVSGHRP